MNLFKHCRKQFSNQLFLYFFISEDIFLNRALGYITIIVIEFKFVEMTSILCMRAGFAASRRFSLPKTLEKRYVTYIQGQSPQPRVREYFYYIDHQGMVFFLLFNS